ncbi:Nramp family divalent metal transporter [Bowmanella dokdonensis]|uniref:Nramp family divalent metal transporter n=1 Tax=Bowmanella dokdonensis TaxID=751969 RepID=A0A939DPP9_9ALTE|nr:Nramp family divalent metal transporter [Bowmanella dokdonensis]MBN7826684.1 Nramp family divalent metal transporter [Bowmanella dokdonensis]
MRFGPGFLVTAAFIGPGTITTASMAGANFGFSLLWVLVFSITATLVLQGMAARLGLVTGMGLAESLRENLSTPWARWLASVLVVSAIGIGSAAYEAGNLTGAALGIQSLLGGQLQGWSLLLAAVAGALLFSGRYALLEHTLIGLVLLMSLVFITTMVMSRPDIPALFEGLLLPSIPAGGLTTTLALVGTTIVPYNLFLHSSLVARQKQRLEKNELRKIQCDSGLAISLGGLITLAIVSTASAAFFGQQLEGGSGMNAGNMARQLEPLLGSLAQYFFAVGLFAAGLTSAITAPLAGAYAVCGILGWSTDLNAKRFRGVWASILLCGALGASTQMSPVAVILFAQATNGVLLPITAIYLLWLMNKKALLREYRNGFKSNLLAALIILFLLGLSSYKLWSLL